MNKCLAKQIKGIVNREIEKQISKIKIWEKEKEEDSGEKEKDSGKKSGSNLTQEEKCQEKIGQKGFQKIAFNSCEKKEEKCSN